MTPSFRGSLALGALCAIVIVAIILRIVQSRLPQAVVRIGGETLTIEIAKTPLSRAKGLSGRKELAPGHGMWFSYSLPTIPAMWMKGMKFPIDIVWIDGVTVVDIAPRVPPPAAGEPLLTYTPRAQGDAVLEVESGFVERTGLKIGDTVEAVQ